MTDYRGPKNKLRGSVTDFKHRQPGCFSNSKLRTLNSKLVGVAIRKSSLTADITELLSRIDANHSVLYSGRNMHNWTLLPNEAIVALGELVSCEFEGGYHLPDMVGQFIIGLRLAPSAAFLKIEDRVRGLCRGITPDPPLYKGRVPASTTKRLTAIVSEIYNCGSAGRIAELTYECLEVLDNLVRGYARDDGTRYTLEDCLRSAHYTLALLTEYRIQGFSDEP